jgi:hypothetical protein
LGLAACDGQPGVTASDYRRSCNVDAECVLIYEGQLTCCGVICTNAAIAKTDEEKYWTDVNARTPTCSPAPPCVAFTSRGCMGPLAVACVAGACTAVTP